MQLNAPMVINPETLALLDSFSEADWDLFTRMAKAEGVAPLMHYAFTRSTYPLPDATRQKLLMIYYETAAFNQMILVEMGRVVQALNDANIPVIVLKGAALASTIYPDPALRPMSDLDILTAAPFVGKAVKLLRSRGYELLKITNHAVLTSEEVSKISVELHWALVGEHPISDSEIARLISETAMETSVSGKRLSFTFLYLCAHLVLQHTEGRLIWLYDIYDFLRFYQKKLDWDSLLSLAQQLNWTPVLNFSMQAIAERFNYQPPDEFQVVFKESLDKSPALKIDSVQSLMTRAFWALGFFDRLLMAFYFLFPAPGYLKKRYRVRWSWQTVFYYPYRWWKMIAESL